MDADLIEKKIDIVEECLTYLRKTGNVDLSEFLDSYEKT